MDIIETVSILSGSAILLPIFSSIIYESITERNSKKKNVISALNDKWQKLRVSAS